MATLAAPSRRPLGQSIFPWWHKVESSAAGSTTTNEQGGIKRTRIDRFAYEPGFRNVRDAYVTCLLLVDDISRLVDSDARRFTFSWHKKALALEQYSALLGLSSGKVNQTIAEIYKTMAWGNDPAIPNDPAPDPGALAHALAWVLSLNRDLAFAGREWVEPNVTVGTKGRIVLEWWHGERALGVYISSSDATYIKDWGADTDNEMADGDASTPGISTELLRWLFQ